MSELKVPDTLFNAKEWLSYFEMNQKQRFSIPWECGIEVESHLRLPLNRSLQRFQVGEQGDGMHLRFGAMQTGDPDYHAAIDLFIKEEQEHSRLLARLIEGMKGSLLPSHWSDTCFVLIRRFSGLHIELFVLLVAEIIAQVYYKVLYDGTTDMVLRSVFAQILHDELGHVAFHCSYLHRALIKQPPLLRSLILKGWQLFYMPVCLLVMYDHRSVFQAMGVKPSVFWHDCMLAFYAARNAIKWGSY